jgi:hypothetical protein
MLLHDVVIDKDQLAACCKRYDVRRLWLFGSILRPTFRADSDVDVLVELVRPIGLFRLGGLREDLSDLFGRDVHLTTLGSVPAPIQSQLMQEAQLQYAA